MKKPIVAVIGMTVALTMLSGCSKDEVEETIQPLVADAIEEEDSEAEAVEDGDESPLIPEIDTSVKIQAGSRIAVVSKSTKGEYWKMVKNGMEDAVAAINDAYGYKKDDAITMTFEGPDNEEEIWIPVRHSLKQLMRMGFRLLFLTLMFLRRSWCGHIVVQIMYR